MHNTRKGRLTLLAIVCALVTLAIGGMAAWASVGDGWVSPDSLSGSNTLTVQAAENDEAYTNDLMTADVVVDIFKVASASGTIGYDNFTYTLAGDYVTLEDQLNGALAGDGVHTWQQFADEAAKVAINGLNGDGTIALGDSAALEDGLYLVMAHGRGITDGLKAESTDFTYTFNPVIVALPTKTASDDNGGVINTAYGDTVTSQTVFLNLKSSREMRFGAIRINKTVVDENGNVTTLEDGPATFEYRITGTTRDGKAYNNVASITIQPGESMGFVDVKHIPSGTTLTVEETYYDTRRFTPVSGPVPEQWTVTPGEDVPCVVFEFVNAVTGTGQGYGIQNNYTYDDSVTDWVWTATPDDNAKSSSEW